MIRNLHGLGLIGVDCPQRGVLCDGNLIARVDERAVFHFPSEEVFGIFRRKYAGGAAAYILLVIRCYVFVLVLNVCDREAILCGGEERGNRNGAVKLGIYIEQRAVGGINPSRGLFRERFKQFLKLFGIRKLCAVRNFNRYRISVRRGRQVNRSFNNRRLPLCVERNALCRHRAGEDIRRAFAKLVIIPACKREVCGYTVRSCQGGVCHIGNILLILAAFSFFWIAAVNELDVIRVTGVVELCIIVGFSILSTVFIRETSNGILILFRHIIARTGACIRMMQFILNSIIGCSATLTGENFHIIICSLTTITGLRSIEFRTIQWHGINIYLIWTSGRINSPSAASLICRPFIADIRAMFCMNG